MNHPTLTAALAAEHRRDLLRDAARSQMIADLPDHRHHRTARRRPLWWTRTTFLLGHRAVASAP